MSSDDINNLRESIIKHDHRIKQLELSQDQDDKDIKELTKDYTVIVTSVKSAISMAKFITGTFGGIIAIITIYKFFFNE